MRFPALAVLALFAVTLLYNGPGHSLHWLSVSVIILLIWLAIGIAKFDGANSVFRHGWLPITAVAYFGWLLVSPWLSTYPYATWSAAMQLALLPLVLLAWLLVPTKHEESVWRLALRGLLCGGILIAAWGIYHYFFLKTRAHGPLIDANAYAALVNLFLLPCMVAFLAQPNWRRLHDSTLLGVILLLAVAQAASLSRGGLIAFIAVLPLVLWHCRLTAFKGRGLAILLILISAHLTLELSPVDASRPILRAPDKLLENDSNLQARFKIWKSTWSIVKDSNPIVGTGLGTFKTYYSVYRDPAETQSSGNLAHNDYLQALQEGGLIQFTFFLVFLVFAPIYLLLQIHTRKHFASAVPSAGLLIGIVCVSVHGLVNFIQFVAPIAVLTGLSLARAWQHSTVVPSVSTVPVLARNSPFYKTVVIALVSAPVFAITADGVIFATLASSNTSLHSSSTTTLNIALTIRPSNPIPRATLINKLLDTASRTDEETARKRFLDLAESESKLLASYAPALAAGTYFLGKTRAMRGDNDDLIRARADLEDAVRRIPPATSMRLELIKLYERTGENEAAYRTVLEAKKWLHLEKDYSALAAFAYRARAVAAMRDDVSETEYWSWIHSRLTELGFAG